MTFHSNWSLSVLHCDPIVIPILETVTKTITLIKLPKPGSQARLQNALFGKASSTGRAFGYYFHTAVLQTTAVLNRPSFLCVGSFRLKDRITKVSKIKTSVVVAFSLLARILGVCSFIYSFKKWRLTPAH